MGLRKSTSHAVGADVCCIPVVMIGTSVTRDSLLDYPSEENQVRSCTWTGAYWLVQPVGI